MAYRLNMKTKTFEVLIESRAKFIVTEDCGEQYENTNPLRFGVSLEVVEGKEVRDVTPHNMTKEQANIRCAEMNTKQI